VLGAIIKIGTKLNYFFHCVTNIKTTTLSKSKKFYTKTKDLSHFNRFDGKIYNRAITFGTIGAGTITAIVLTGFSGQHNPERPSDRGAERRDAVGRRSSSCHHLSLAWSTPVHFSHARRASSFSHLSMISLSLSPINGVFGDAYRWYRLSTGDRERASRAAHTKSSNSPKTWTDREAGGGEQRGGSFAIT